MTTPGGTPWGGSLCGRSIGNSIERYLVLVGGRVVICGFFRAGNVSLAHCLMTWWSVFIAASLFPEVMVGALSNEHARVVTPWTMRSISVTVDCVR